VRPIELRLTPELDKYTNGGDVAKSPAYKISTYRKLVEQVARLAYLHKNQLLFFRGQGKDFQNKVAASTFYPTIYRGEYVSQEEIKSRFGVLDECCRQLRRIFQASKLEGEYEVSRKTLLDFTHSLRVACSFAQAAAKEKDAFVYVFGLPYLSNRISINSEEDLVNVRLLSICPPQALRPYFQDGYQCGTTDLLWEYQDKTELDFNRRLIAKFLIPRQPRFWGKGFQMIPSSVFFPRGDQVEALCKQILPSARKELYPDPLGTFIREWSRFEKLLTTNAQSLDPKVQSALGAVATLQHFRKFRNRAVHSPESVESEEIYAMTRQVREINAVLRKKLGAK